MKYLLFLTAIFFLFSGCREKDIEEKLPQQFPSIILENFSITETKQGKKLWTLNAARARVFDKIIKVDTIKIKFYDENEAVFSLLNAPRGVLDTKSHNIQALDSVTVYTDDSTKLFTKSLFWNNDSARILTNDHIRIVKKDGTVIEGEGLKTDPGLKKIEIIGSTKGISPIELPNINR